MILAGGDPRLDPGVETTFDSRADARGADIDVVALRLSSGRVIVAVAGVTEGGESG